MGRLQLAICLIAFWCASTVYAAGVILSPVVEQENTNSPSGQPLTDEQIACLFAALDSGQDPNTTCGLE
jgi:hypothetical protein